MRANVPLRARLITPFGWSYNYQPHLKIKEYINNFFKKNGNSHLGTKIEYPKCLAFFITHNLIKIKGAHAFFFENGNYTSVLRSKKSETLSLLLHHQLTHPQEMLQE